MPSASSLCRSTVSLLCAAFWAPLFALTAPQATSLADYFVQQTGRAGGIASLPQAGDGQLALALLQRSQMMVHAMGAQDVDVQTVRGLFDPTGLSGRRAYAEKGSPASIPFADNYVDLLVITNVNDGGVGSIPVAEIARVLCPGGKAFVGRAAVEGAGLSTTTLQAWGSGRSDAQVVTDAQGTWAVITKRESSGTDVWRHSLHGPDNNPFAADSVVKFPFLPQWRGKPYAGLTRHGNIVAAGGRLYAAINQGNGNGNLYLRAYRIWNGSVLWTRNLRNYTTWEDPTLGSFIVALDNGAYLADSNNVKQLAGETGAVVRTIIPDSTTGVSVKWIALSGATLFALTGDTALDSLGGNGWSKYFNGTRITAWDTVSHTVLWRHTEAGRIDSRDIGVAAGKVFFYTRGTHVVALDAAGGAQAWENHDTAVVRMLESYMGGDTYWPVGSGSGFTCTQWGVFICQPEDGFLAALSAANGSLMWQATRSGNRSLARVVMGNGLLFARDVVETDKHAWNLVTGQTVTQYQNISMGGGCGLITAAWDGIFGNAGGQSYSFSAGRNIGSQPFKTDCGISMILSDGMAVNPNATGCTCLPNRGMIVECAAGAFAFDRTAVQSERLEAGPADADLSVQVVPDSLDWPMHRANAGHTGASKAALPATWQLLWTYHPAFPYDSTVVNCNDAIDGQNTQPLVVGTLVFWAGTDGCVRCYDQSARALRWSYATGGRVMATPTVANGCVFVGSTDGYAYCIEAHSGRLVWRFRGSPVDRRISLYGGLSSTWPVNSGVLVQGDTAYFAAGFGEGYGTHVYAVNARTGNLVWQNNASGTLYSSQDRDGTPASGYLLIVGSHLWLRSHHGRNGIYDLSTGALQPMPAALSGRDGGPSRRGYEIGLLDPTHVVFGGRYQYMDHDERQVNGQTSFNFNQLDASGLPQYAEVSLLNTSTLNAWDSQDFFTATWGSAALEKWSVAAMTHTVDSTRAQHSDPSAYQWWQEFAVRMDWNGSSAATPLGGAWRMDSLDMNAIVLASNAVVVTSCTKANQWDPQQNWHWSLLVLPRDHVDTLWHVALPGIPLHNGVAISRRGDIIVTMRSGTMLCYGGSPVSVLARGTEIPTAMPQSALPMTDVKSDGWQTAAPVMRTSVAHDNGHATAADDQNAASNSSMPVSLATTSDRGSALLTGETAVNGAPACRASSASSDPSSVAAEPRAYVGHSTTWNPPQACVPVASISASSSEGVHGARCAIDRDLRTRWTPGSAGPQWLTLDLGHARQVSSVSLVWYSPKPTTVALEVETSVDGRTFTEADQGTLVGRGTQTTVRTFVPTVARWVRLRVASTAAAASVYEVGIHDMAAVDRQAAR